MLNKDCGEEQEKFNEMGNRNLYRRIEALEKSWSGKLAARRCIAAQVLWGLTYQDWERIVSAHGAERAGRALSAPQVAARQAYRDALEKECYEAGLHPPRKSNLTPNLLQAMTHLVTYRFSPAEFQVLISAVRATEQQRRPLTEPEVAALQDYELEVARVCELAGLPSTAEFRFVSPAEESMKTWPASAEHT